MQPSEQRRAERYYDPGTTAYYWDGSSPVPREIRDISLTGAYLCTPERWYPGTIVKLVLRANRAGVDVVGESIEIRCRVVRHGPDGVGLQFMSHEVNERKGLHRFIASIIANLRRKKTPDTRASTRGQALIEVAFMVPVLFFIMVLAIDYGGFFYAWITVANAARSGAQYAALGSASAKAPGTPTNTQVINLISGSGSDTSSLISSVSVCVNTNTTNSSITGTCSFTIPSIPADPEPTCCVLKAVDVKYTYSPIIPAFNLPGFGISIPGMPSSFQIRTLMRWL
ncbi:MAG TPA: PilZ domain-containing protein [Bryobacteraceae bacterium]|nr:PilZ domain-containing protein [Bryobacteraceae bacterium]